MKAKLWKKAGNPPSSDSGRALWAAFPSSFSCHHLSRIDVQRTPCHPLRSSIQLLTEHQVRKATEDASARPLSMLHPASSTTRLCTRIVGTATSFDDSFETRNWMVLDLTECSLSVIAGQMGQGDA